VFFAVTEHNLFIINVLRVFLAGRTFWLRLSEAKPRWVLCELCGCNSIMQNKANVKMGKMAISTATIKAYANKQRTMSNKRYSKQTQSNPIPPTQYAIRNTKNKPKQSQFSRPAARYDRRGVERLSGV